MHLNVLFAVDRAGLVPWRRRDPPGHLRRRLSSSQIRNRAPVCALPTMRGAALLAAAAAGAAGHDRPPRHPLRPKRRRVPRSPGGAGLQRCSLFDCVLDTARPGPERRPWSAMACSTVRKSSLPPGRAAGRGRRAAGRLQAHPASTPLPEGLVPKPSGRLRHGVVRGGGRHPPPARIGAAAGAGPAAGRTGRENALPHAVGAARRLRSTSAAELPQRLQNLDARRLGRGRPCLYQMDRRMNPERG